MPRLMQWNFLTAIFFSNFSEILGYFIRPCEMASKINFWWGDGDSTWQIEGGSAPNANHHRPQLPISRKKSRGQKTKNSQPEFLVIISRFTSISSRCAILCFSYCYSLLRLRIRIHRLSDLGSELVMASC